MGDCRLRCLMVVPVSVSSQVDQIADELAGRLTRIFLRDDARDGRRAVFGDHDVFQRDPQWRDLSFERVTTNERVRTCDECPV